MLLNPRGHALEIKWNKPYGNKKVRDPSAQT